MNYLGTGHAQFLIYIGYVFGCHIFIIDYVHMLKGVTVVYHPCVDYIIIMCCINQ